MIIRNRYDHNLLIPNFYFLPLIYAARATFEKKNCSIKHGLYNLFFTISLTKKKINKI